MLLVFLYLGENSLRGNRRESAYSSYNEDIVELFCLQFRLQHVTALTTLISLTTAVVNGLPRQPNGVADRAGYLHSDAIQQDAGLFLPCRAVANPGKTSEAAPPLRTGFTGRHLAASSIV